jgi:hypothetical protein
MTPHEQAREKILQLESALLSSHPTMPGLLREIHTQLKNDPEIVTLLSEEEIHIVVSGLSKQTMTVLTAAAKTSSTKKSLSKSTADDLGF